MDLGLNRRSAPTPVGGYDFLNPPCLSRERQKRGLRSGREVAIVYGSRRGTAEDEFEL